MDAPVNTNTPLSAAPNNRRLAAFWKKAHVPAMAAALAFALGVTAVLAIVPSLFPGIGADTADALRGVFGPQPVAALESISFQLQDALNQARSELNGGRIQLTWSAQQQNNTRQESPAYAVKSTRSQGLATSKPLPAAASSVAGAPLAPHNPSASISNVISDPPQIGWQAYGPVVNGQPVMARAMILSDPQRSYAGVALVRIDLSRTRFHVMPGSLEPSHSAQVVQAIPELGMVPPQDQTKLIAAFNGGFKALHGHFGMMAAGVPMLPPIPGMATIAFYQDGFLQLGTWGRDINPAGDMVAFRQNCPPLIESGQLNPALSGDNRQAWGFTNNSDITWRTGLGLTHDDRYLIYAVGNGTSAETLAQALQQAGSYNAMQLDINQFYAHFYTYQSSDPSTSSGFSLLGQRLLDQMINNPHLYLTPNARDFFYITTR